MASFDLEQAANALLDAACPVAERRRFLEYPWLMPQCFRRRWKHERPLERIFPHHDPPAPERADTVILREADIDAERAKISDRLREAMVPNEERLCLILPFFGFSDRDIAFVAGLNVTTVGLRRKRAWTKIEAWRARNARDSGP